MSKSSYLKTFTASRSPAEVAFQKLNGLLCIYKPPNTNLIEIIRKIKLGFVKGLNEIPTRPVQDIVKFDDSNNSVYLESNRADTVQALGYRYMLKDFKLSALHPLDEPDSGVQIFSINDRSMLLTKIANMRLMRVYEIKGRLGVWTEDHLPSGNLVQKASFDHVNRSKLDRLMSSIQLSYQKEMFKIAGLDLKSQEAYELASKGLLRPKSLSIPPQIYSLRCTEFHKPYFKIEVYTINESTRFLRQLVHDIGMRLRAYAICCQIRRISDGFVSFKSTDCVTSNQLNYEPLLRSTVEITSLAKQYVNKYDKTILMGHTNEEEKQLIYNASR